MGSRGGDPRHDQLTLWLLLRDPPVKQLEKKPSDFESENECLKTPMLFMVYPIVPRSAVKVSRAVSRFFAVESGMCWDGMGLAPIAASVRGGGILGMDAVCQLLGTQGLEGQGSGGRQASAWREGRRMVASLLGNAASSRMGRSRSGCAKRLLFSAVTGFFRAGQQGPAWGFLGCATGAGSLQRPARRLCRPRP